MSRLDEEYLMAVVRNRSGIDSGEIDYCIPFNKFQKQTIESLGEIKDELMRLFDICDDRIDDINNCAHEWEKDCDSRLNVMRCIKCSWRKFE